MEVDSSEASSPNLKDNPQTFTPSSRITDLNEIDTSISTLLTSASTAISILANDRPSTSLDKDRESFTSSAQTYFSTLSSIEVRLRRQVYALEEAGLIPAGSERDARNGRKLNTDDGLNRRGVGSGALDPSWLNARVSDAVEVRKKKELLEEGKEFVRMMRRKGSKDKDGDVNMDGDEGSNG